MKQSCILRIRGFLIQVFQIAEVLKIFDLPKMYSLAECLPTWAKEIEKQIYRHHPRFPKVFLLFDTEQQAEVVENKVENGHIMQSMGIKIFGHRCDTPTVNIVLNGRDMTIEKEVRD